MGKTTRLYLSISLALMPSILLGDTCCLKVPGGRRGVAAPASLGKVSVVPPQQNLTSPFYSGKWILKKCICGILHTDMDMDIIFYIFKRKLFLLKKNSTLFDHDSKISSYHLLQYLVIKNFTFSKYLIFLFGVRILLRLP